MKLLVFCTVLFVFVCNGAADGPASLEQKILTVLPGKLTEYQLGLVMPSKYQRGICLLADRNMERYPKDLAFKAALQIIARPHFFIHPEPPQAVVAQVMSTEDLIKSAVPAIALFLLFDLNSITTVPGYTTRDKEKTTYYTHFNAGSKRPEILILNSNQDAPVTELHSHPEILELQRRGATEAVKKKQVEVLEKKNFDIAVRINHQAIKDHFDSIGSECIIL